MNTRIKKAGLLTALVAAYGLMLSGGASAQILKPLHGFADLTISSNSDGVVPVAGLILSGSTLYGTATAGGISGNGTVFKVNTGGTGFTTLHGFTAIDPDAGTNSDGAAPDAGLILSGSTLYGTTSAGGISGSGTVFKVTTTGTGFTTVHSFTTTDPDTGANSDGAAPVAGLILSGSTLYGTTSGGGDSANGTVFKVNTDGTGFTTLYSFTATDPDSGTNSDGASPVAGLILSGNTLYGTASGGGVSGGGTVFKITTNGTGFTTLYSFTSVDTNTSTNLDGFAPVAGLILSGTTLYGTARQGGDWADGTVFKITTNGTGFTTLYSFTAIDPDAGTNIDGAEPEAGLILSGSTLYGTTSGAGGSSYGTVFSVSTNGGSFVDVYDFTDGSDGASPQSGLILSGSTLYGTVSVGGDLSEGAIFAVTTDGATFTTLHSFTTLMTSTIDGAYPVAGLTLSGNTLYGTTPGADASLGGSVFKVNIDGTGFATVYSFSAPDPDVGTNNDGAMPDAGLVLSGSTLYGTASAGGSSGAGTVFKVNTDGTGFKAVYNFTATDPDTGTNNDGATPLAGLILSGSTLYGTASAGGTGGAGTVFKVNTSGTGFGTVYNFTAPDPTASTNNDGATPMGGLVLSGSTLYGTASAGGETGSGTVFKVNTGGTGFTTLHSFTASDPDTGTNSDGATPDAGLILSGGTIYGTAAMGGSSAGGTLFKVNTDGTAWATLYSFTATDPDTGTNSDGAAPDAGLILSGSTLLGTAFGGGTFGYGTVFQVNTDGTHFTSLYSFMSDVDGASPRAGLVLSSNSVYGTTSTGGNAGFGTVFSLFIQPQLSIALAGTNVVLTWTNTASGFTLQSTTNVFPAAWTNVSPAPVVTSGQNTVTNHIPGKTKFYRLSQ